MEGNTVPATLKTMARFFISEERKRGLRGAVKRKRERWGGVFIRFFETQVSSLAVYSSPSDRDVPASASRAGFAQWVYTGRNSSAHLSLRGGKWCQQVRLLSHSEDLQNVRGLCSRRLLRLIRWQEQMRGQTSGRVDKVRPYRREYRPG